MPDVEFFGEKFTSRGAPSEWALMELADAAETDAGNLQSHRAALLRLVRDILAEDDWQRFSAVARKNRADLDSLLAVVRTSMEDATERPTGQPSDSSDGQPVTVLKSVPSLEGKVEQAFPGRPEIQAGILDMMREQVS